MPDDFSQLKEMIYSGRQVSIGETPNGNPFIGYTITGRSPPSQARELLPNGTGTLRTNIITDEIRLRKMFNITTDSELAELKRRIEQGNKALLVYDALVDCGHRLVASNGAQTRLIVEASQKKRGFMINPEEIMREAMEIPVWEEGIDITAFEPDKPNYTQRVSGCLDLKKNLGAFRIVRRNRRGEKEVDGGFRFSLEAGRAIGITTYDGENTDPLRPYDKMYPLEFKVSSNSAQDLADSLFDAINHVNPVDGKNYAVASAVMLRGKNGKLETSVRNRWDGF